MNEQVYLALGMEKAKDAKWHEAKTAFSKAIEENPQSYEAYDKLGLVLKNLKCYEEAEEYFLTALKLMPKYAPAYNNLGILKTEQEDIKGAKAAFQRAIQIQDDYIDAYYNLGLLYYGIGELEEALAVFDILLTMAPQLHEIHTLKGAVLEKLERLEEAERAFQESDKQDPKQIFNLLSLGNLQYRAGQWEKAELSFFRVIQIDPNHADAHLKMALAVKEQKRLPEAEALLRQALLLQPEFPEACNALGIVLAEMKNLGDAISFFCQAIEQNKEYAEAYGNLGMALKETHGLAEAEACLLRAIELQPDYLEGYNNLGIVLKDQNRVDEAKTCFLKALSLNENCSEVHHNLGNLCRYMNQLDEAEAFYEKAITLNPACLIAKCSLAIIYLLRGDYERGWKNFEIRYLIGESFDPKLPRWHGEDLSDKSILIYFDQGFGDTLQFIRFAYLVAAKAKHTTVWVQTPIKRLLAGTQDQFTIYAGSNYPPGNYDFACPLLSLPYEFSIPFDQVSFRSPYIQSMPSLREQWRIRLQNVLPVGKRLRVGIVWAGNPNHDNDHNRSIPFSLFKDLFTVPSINWVSLQVGSKAADIQEAPVGSILNLAEELSDFAETAAVIDNLDLIITVDSSVSHLAGAMGKPTWIFIPFSPDWRWAMDREDTPWYPHTRLFRQKTAGDWPTVIKTVKKALLEFNLR
ncbi:MAG: tetratricopeptide repeat protein [Sporomusaceae bacterium]|nr:tetratricopeptide repeat protein [Sporomusaceae bacterium]